MHRARSLVALGALAFLAACAAGTTPATVRAKHPTPFAVEPAPPRFAPATVDGHVVPSYGSGYNPETGTEPDGR